MTRALSPSPPPPPAAPYDRAMPWSRGTYRRTPPRPPGMPPSTNWVVFSGGVSACRIVTGWGGPSSAGVRGLRPVHAVHVEQRNERPAHELFAAPPTSMDDCCAASPTWPSERRSRLRAVSPASVRDATPSSPSDAPSRLPWNADAPAPCLMSRVSRAGPWLRPRRNLDYFVVACPGRPLARRSTRSRQTGPRHPPRVQCRPTRVPPIPNCRPGPSRPWAGGPRCGRAAFSPS